jgi:hypothetical protein
MDTALWIRWIFKLIFVFFEEESHAIPCKPESQLALILEKKFYIAF